MLIKEIKKLVQCKIKEGIFFESFEEVSVFLSRHYCLPSRAHRTRVSFIHNAYRLHHNVDLGRTSSNMHNTYGSHKYKKVFVKACQL